MAKKQSKTTLPGELIIIGGHEDKEGERVILKQVAKAVGQGKLCVATVASNLAGELWAEYRKVFRELGVKQISHLNVDKREDASKPAALKALAGANAVFFTGGDQLKITSELGGSLAADRIQQIYNSGGLIAGTSAGASMMSETMLVSGASDSSFRMNGSLRMAPGLGFMREVLIDQHFAERGRIGRLVGAIAQNPRFIGIGIDENTAIMVTTPKGSRTIHRLEVVGAGAVYIVDAREATGSNISEAKPEDALSIFNVRLHILSHGDNYEVESRVPGLRAQAA
jgi:cyanophycinase